MSTLPTSSTATGGLPPAPLAGLRRCGRCRQDFPEDPTLLGNGQPDWWLCPPCHESLMGPDAPRRTAVRPT